MIKDFLDSDEISEGKTPKSGTAGSSGLNILEFPVSKLEPEPDPYDPYAVTDLPVAEPQKPVSQRNSEHNPEPFSYTPPTPAESARMSGLAFTAGIALVSSVVFMLVIGWFADLLFGSAPWGLVGGIILGSVIGFIQFFRLNSQILGSTTSTSRPNALFGDPETRSPPPPVTGETDVEKDTED